MTTLMQARHTMPVTISEGVGPWIYMLSLRQVFLTVSGAVHRTFPIAQGWWDATPLQGHPRAFQVTRRRQQLLEVWELDTGYKQGEEVA